MALSGASTVDSKTTHWFPDILGVSHGAEVSAGGGANDLISSCVRCIGALGGVYSAVYWLLYFFGCLCGSHSSATQNGHYGECAGPLYRVWFDFLMLSSL